MHSTLLVSVLLACGVTARNCNQGLRYCGQTLFNIGTMMKKEMNAYLQNSRRHMQEMIPGD